MKRLTAILLLLFLSLFLLSAATPLAYQSFYEYYEPTNAKTRATAGGGLLFLEDSSKIWNNPASLGGIRRSTVSSELYLATNYDVDADISAFSKFGLGASFHLSYNSFYDAFFSYALGYGQSVELNGATLSLGISGSILGNIRSDRETFIRKSAPVYLSFPFAVSSSVAFDSGIRFGFALRNLFASYRKMNHLLDQPSSSSFREEWKRAEVSYQKEMTGDVAVGYAFRTVDAAFELDMRDIWGFADVAKYGLDSYTIEVFLSHIVLSGTYEVMENLPLYASWTGNAISLGVGYRLGSLEITGSGSVNCRTGFLSGAIGVLLDI